LLPFDVPADRRLSDHPQEKLLEPPPHPPDVGSEEPLPQHADAKVEKTFFRLSLPHFGHFSDFTEPALPAV
jgi:hypothetical protein